VIIKVGEKRRGDRDLKNFLEILKNICRFFNKFHYIYIYIGLFIYTYKYNEIIKY